MCFAGELQIRIFQHSFVWAINTNVDEFSKLQYSLKSKDDNKVKTQLEMIVLIVEPNLTFYLIY